MDDKNHSKQQRRRMLRTTTVRERVNTVQCTFTTESARLVNKPITFPLINPKWVILLHEDALVLTLGLSGFDVCKILIDRSSSIDLL